MPEESAVPTLSRCVGHKKQTQTRKRAGMVKAQACAAIALIGLVMVAGAARAADTTIAPGQDYTLPAALLLSGGDNFNAGASAGARCKLHGGGLAISSGPGGAGAGAIRNCDRDRAGDANTPARPVSGRRPATGA